MHLIRARTAMNGPSSWNVWRVTPPIVEGQVGEPSRRGTNGVHCWSTKSPTQSSSTVAPGRQSADGGLAPSDAELLDDDGRRPSRGPEHETPWKIQPGSREEDEPNVVEIEASTIGRAIEPLS